MKNFKYILAGFLALGTLGGLIWFLQPKLNSGAKIAVLDPKKDESEVLATVRGIASEGSCVADTLKEELAQEHERLLERVQKAFPLTKQKWEHTLLQIDLAISQDCLLTDKPVIKNKPNDLPIVKKAREILASYHIDPAAVTIKVIHNPKTKTNAASYQGYADNKVIHDLELNIPQLSKHTHDIQEAIIRHEIMHLLNYDPLKRAYIEVMFMENGIKPEEFMKEPALLELYQHQEFRADLMAACHDICTAQSLQKDFEHYIQTCPEDQVEHTCITHPSDVARHQAVTQLISYLHAENNIRLA